MSLRLLQALRKEPDWSAMSDHDLATFTVAENRRRSAALTRVVSGFPARRTLIGWEQVPLPDRVVRVRTYRPAGRRDDSLPLVLHVHGGGFVGTAVQSDWINSHLAARLPAVVVSVEHRLTSHTTPLSAAVDDGWDVLRLTARDRVAVIGESAGAVVAATAALRARDAGLKLRAQVLVNPCTDLTATALDYPSVREHADTPMLTVRQIQFFRQLAAPAGADPRSVSPLYADDLGGLAPALVVVPTHDPVADHGRAYARRLAEAGTPVRLAEFPGAPHAFVSIPGLVFQARAARAQITDFLRTHLT